MRKASTRTSDGIRPEARTSSRARRIARNVAATIPIASISAAVAAPTAAPRAASRIRIASASRTAGSRAFESSSPGNGDGPSNTTAPAYTGPATQPRPTSSTPAINAWPSARASFSIAKRPATRSRSAARSHALRLPPDPIVPRFLPPGLPFASSTRCPGAALPRSVVALLRDAGGLAATIPQVIQLRAPHLTVPLDLDPLEHGRVHRERAFHADTLRNLANGERLARAAASPGDHEALEHLNAFLLAFLDLHVNLDRVSGRERGNVESQGGLLGHQQLVRHR